MPNRSRSIHPSRLFRSVSPQSPAIYVHSCCFPRQTTLSVDLQLFIAATSLIRVFLRVSRERVGYESMFRGRRKHKSFVHERKEKRKAFSCNVHISRLLVRSVLSVASPTSTRQLADNRCWQDELSWIWNRVLGCHVTKESQDVAVKACENGFLRWK